MENGIAVLVGQRSKTTRSFSTARARTEVTITRETNSMDARWRTLRARLGTDYVQSRLHSEILALCRTQELTPEQVRVRNFARDYIEQAVLELWPTARVCLYGSTANGLALLSSDIDLAVVLPSDQQSNFDWRVPDEGWCVSALRANLDQKDRNRDDKVFESLTQIPFSRVPILKAKFTSGLYCDVSFDWRDNRTGRSGQVVREFVERYQALKPLCIVLKLFLRRLGLNDSFTGGVSSFCLTVMIVSHLQNLGDECADYDLGALLVSFLTHFSCKHDYRTDVVCTSSTGKNLSKSKRTKGWEYPHFPNLLAVESPLDPFSDIGAASYNIDEVRTMFYRAKEELLGNWHAANPLDLMLRMQYSKHN